MFLSQDLENSIKDNEKKLRLIEIELEKMERMSASHFEELDVTPEQLAAFADNPDNFTEKDWEALQARRKELDEQLEKEMSQVRDRKRNAQVWAERRVDPRWLFVR